MLRQIAQRFFHFCAGGGGELVVHLAEVFLHIGDGIVIELTGVGKVVFDQIAQGFGGFAVEIDFRQGHEVFQSSAETFGEIQAQQFAGGKFQGRGEGDALDGRLVQRVSAHRLPRAFRGIGSLYLNGARQILIGVGMIGVGGQHNSVERGGSVVRKADMMRI